MKSRPITVDNTMQELTQHGTLDFPISMDEQHLSEEGCHEVLHWHYEIQIATVVRGSAIFSTNTESYRLEEGQGIFINSGVLHEVTATEQSDSAYLCVNFKPELICSDKESAIYRDYIAPLVNNLELSAVVLDAEPWHQEIIQHLHAMSSVMKEREYGYELLLLNHLSYIWNKLTINNRNHTEKTATTSFAERQRILVLKKFIHQNYMEPLTLAEIAAAGHISRGECCRIFSRTNHPSPIAYLKEYRLSQSLKLLTCTQLGISEIAYQTGFQSSSYYSACFKKEMKCTPLEYRFRHLNSQSNHE